MNKITLKSPVTVGGICIESVTLRRPKVRDRLAVERSNKTDAEKEIALIANLSELSMDTIEELDLYDYSQIQTVLQSFLSPSMLTT